MNVILDYAYAAYLGLALNMFTDLVFNDWELYAFIIPVVMLVNLRDLRS